MDGNARILVSWFVCIAALACFGAASVSFAQALYKYRDADGQLVYSDQPPPDSGKVEVEVRELPKGGGDSDVQVFNEQDEDGLRIEARNDFHAPVEVVIGLDELRNLKQPPAGKSLRMVVPARQQMTLLNLEITDPAQPIAIEYRYVWLPGDPAAQHIPEKPYRAPFAVAGRYPVSQAFPVGITHTTPDSYHAVDLAMPVGTDIYAARAGIVFHVATTNFRGGLDPDKDFSAANIVNILHEDGTFAVYAHLNWNSIRVRPGDRVERGQFIAESGNTGFTTGPHLHFAVLKNRGMGLESVPVEFLGPNNSALTIATGDELIAY